jgi:AbrB family looped-hinge helix DNA binding protein
VNSTVTAKFQVTIPKAVRERLGITVQDSLEWVVEEGKAIVYPVHPEFLRHRNTVKVGPGSVEQDRERARDARVEKYR